MEQWEMVAPPTNPDPLPGAERIKSSDAFERVTGTLPASLVLHQQARRDCLPTQTPQARLRPLSTHPLSYQRLPRQERSQRPQGDG